MSKESKQGNDTIIGDAIAEFDSVLSGKLAAGKLDAMEQSAPKGANQQRRRNVLGRGLSALMSATAIEVEVEPRGATPPNTSATSPGQAGARVPTRPLHRYAPGQVASPAPSSVSNIVAQPESETIAPAEENTLEGGLVYLSIDRVIPSRKQPRARFRDEEIVELSNSIKQSGLLQPIIVRKQQAAAGPLASYEIVAGERRWRAAKLAGLRNLPALVRHLDDRECLELGIVENVQRTDLNPIEEAQAYQRLIVEFGATQEQVAKTVGRDRVSVSNALRLLKLHSIVQQAIIEGILSAGHGRALLQLKEQKIQCQLAERAVVEALSVRALEKLVKTGAQGVASKSGSKAKQDQTKRAPELLALEERFRRALGTKVSLSADANGKGELRISFYSQEELQQLVDKVQA